MLVALSIRDIVLIDELDLILEGGLCALTGETGAGKSILLDALGLAVGARADAGLVAQGRDKGAVTAVFDVPGAHPARALLAAQELESEGDLILRRVQTADGRTRAFINDQPVSVGLMRDVGEALVEVHGQHDERGLLDVSGHRALLDAFARTEAELAKVRETHKGMADALAALEAHRTRLARAEAERDFLTHSLGELEELGPEIGEEEKLAERRSLLMHAEKISEELVAAQEALAGDAGLDARINLAMRRLERAVPQAGGRLEPVLAALERTLAEASEAEALLDDTVRGLEFDPDELEKAETRLFALRALARKHNVQVDDLPALQDRMARELADIDDGASALTRYEKALAETRAAYAKAAEALSDKRMKAAEKLDKIVAKELVPLKLDKATFHTRVETLPVEEGGPEGIDRVSFLISTNPGAPLGPLIKIASGGELSRFILALKVALASAGSAPTLIFDEVDSGVGGAVAEAVGVRLAELARSAQVIVVTHSPQVAARAHHHLRISKSSKGKAKNAPVATQVARLSSGDRREEIARMLAGATVTDEARAAADRLIGSAE
ncbi:DNA repair protein RecN [Tepidicaulis sp. LMO-SS28]|uniref:DNA repair protein RecN n=1 Tax=Tepidicaulis sp. LMO-SS28 TaxID=3447455 RepID=UPI003EE203CB